MADEEKRKRLRLKAAALNLQTPQDAAEMSPEQRIAVGVTPEELQQGLANVEERQQPFIDALTMFQRGLSLGQSPNIQGAVNAAADVLTGGAIGGGFEEGRQQMLEQERQASENLTFGGVPMGMLPEAAGGVVTGRAYAAPLEAAYPTFQGWLGTLLPAAAEGGIYAQGQGQDVLGGMLSGAVGGTLGRGVATGMSKLDDMLPNLNVQENAARRIQQQAEAAGVKPGEFTQMLEGQMGRLGPDATLADVETLRPLLSNLTPMSSTQARADVFEMATGDTRNVADIATTAWSDIFPTPRSKDAMGNAKTLTLNEARTIYETGLNQSPIKFRGKPIADLVNDAFGERPIGNALRAKNAVLSFIAGKTPMGPDGKTRLPMSPRDLLEVKEAVDQLTRESPTGAVDKKVNRVLFDISAKLNDTLKEYVPEVRQAADIYSGQYAFDAAYGEGYDLGKAGLKGQSLQDLRETVQTFTPAQKAAFAEGWRKAKFEQTDAKGFEAMFRRVGPTKSNADLEIIDTLFGAGTGQKFVDASKRINAIEETNRKALNRWKSVSEALQQPKGEGLNVVRQVADLATLLSQVAQNKMLGGAFQGAFGREARAVGAQASAQQGDQILNWLTRSGATPQTAEDAMREIEQYLLRAQPAPLPQALGAEAGRVGAAFERAGRSR